LNAVTPRNTIGHPDKVRYYAGIGSRQTPRAVIEEMEVIGRVLGDHGWHLRSGFADGADQAFFRGALSSDRGMHAVTNYLPWAGFNTAPRFETPRFVVPDMNTIQMEVASQFHPNWKACSPAAKQLHTRNVCQILGEDLVTPSLMVVCWTKDGLAGGGTGQALRIANGYGIPVFDLAREIDKEALAEFVDRN